MRFRLGRFQFECSWWLLLVYVLFLSVLCSLGSWQLQRSEEKREFLARQQEALQRDIVDLNNVSQAAMVEELRYQRVVVKGRPDTEHTFLIDNQIVNGKVGYFVLTPFFIQGRNQAILINRGWIEMGHDRNELPDIGISQEWTTVSGRLNQFPAVGIKLKGAEIPSDGWPSLVQVAEADVLSEKLGYPVYHFQLELDPEQPNGYLRQWRIDTPIPPEKHVAYAVQWFGLALALTGLFLWNSFKKHRG